MNIQGANDLKNIIEKANQRLKFILNFYQKKGPLKKENKYYNQDTIIILLTLREIEIIKDKFEHNEKNQIEIPLLMLITILFLNLKKV